jgi:hypothetical protein
MADKPLPAPNVVVANPLDQLSPEAVRGMLINPIYTGVGPFPRLVEDGAWVRACARLIEEDGAQQFLVNLLYVLRGCFQGNRRHEDYNHLPAKVCPHSKDRSAAQERSCSHPRQAPSSPTIGSRRTHQRDGEPAVEWTWDGNAEMNAATVNLMSAKEQKINNKDIS